VDPFTTLYLLTGRIAPGRTPDFTEAYILVALKVIKARAQIGRKQLSEILQSGEGTIRTLVRRLQDEGLISTSRYGMELTERGVSLLDNIESILYGFEFPKTNITVADNNYAVLVKKGVQNVRYGIEQRDAALLAGAKGASTLVMKDNRFVMPGSETSIDKESLEALRWLKLEDGDVIIIGSADSLLHAEIGAYSAALNLLGT
jgi:predicted transcriptional regulator